MLLPTTLLRHQPPGEPPHFDWLIPLPPHESGLSPRLWTARVPTHWRDWAAGARLGLSLLPPHRHRYLRWSGPLTGGRGWVHRDAQGLIEVHRWTSRYARLSLRYDAPRGVSIEIELDLHPRRPTMLIQSSSDSRG